MSPFLYPPPSIVQPVVIKEDGGGIVTDYIKAAYDYKTQNRRVEIRGSCRSACTLALSVPNVCVGPGAVVRWHHAYEPSSGVIRYDISEMMLERLPFRIRSRIQGHIQVNYNPDATLTYRQLVELGVKDCDDTQVATSKPVEIAPTSAAPTYTTAPTSHYAAPAPQPKQPRRVAASGINPVAAIVSIPLIPFALAARVIRGATQPRR
jgi:hypothetical protein